MWPEAHSTMNFDDILSEINGFGKFQIVLFLIQVLSRISLPCHFLLSNFIAAIPPHHCDVSGLEDGGSFGNLTSDQKVIVGIPKEQDGAPSSCLMFPGPQYQYLFSSNTSEEAFPIKCHNGWVYDKSIFQSTLATEVNQHWFIRVWHYRGEL